MPNTLGAEWRKISKKSRIQTKAISGERLLTALRDRRPGRPSASPSRGANVPVPQIGSRRTAEEEGHKGEANEKEKGKWREKGIIYICIKSTKEICILRVFHFI